MNRELLALAADLSRRHRPFLVATVVWARGPSSGKRGSSAIIDIEGNVTGWIGGACAEPVVRREAREAIADGMTGKQLADEVTNPEPTYCETFEGAAEAVAADLRPGDVFFTVGAGDVDSVGAMVRKLLKARAQR